MNRLLAFLALALALAGALPASGQDAGTVVHLLDYIAVDYPGAVSGGKIRDAGEYREMTEFAASVRDSVARLAENPAKAGLLARADALAREIDAKATERQVASTAGELRTALIAAYRVAIGPKRAPDPSRAKALYERNCASCHGAAGRGDGQLAAGMDPAPSDFADADRQRQRSVHGLYNTITLGVAGTAMRPFKELDEDERWALAYLAAAWGITAEEAARGKAAWEAGRHRQLFRNHAAVAGASATDVEIRYGSEAAAVHAYLRSAPAALDRVKPDPIELARARIRESVELHAAGRREEAVQAALAGYLEGFELAEAALATVDPAMVRRIESLMIDFRNELKSAAAHERVQAAARTLDAALEDASRALSGPALSPATAAIASFVILFREGLEAVLVVTALLAFLRRSGQVHAIPYLHAGWITALIAGLATWAAATWLVEVSGAGRELTEGISALVAAAMLLYVGFWLHDKSHADAWQRFIVRGAGVPARGAAWGLAFMAFLAVYREVFETVLFYQALWAQAAGAAAAIGGGIVAAAAVLAATTWALLRYSLRLPLGTFFGASGLLLAFLAIVLAGNGVAALQEAGTIPVTPVAFPSVPWLGIHANRQALAAQVAFALVVVALYGLSRARAAKARPAP